MQPEKRLLGFVGRLLVIEERRIQVRSILVRMVGHATTCSGSPGKRGGGWLYWGRLVSERLSRWVEPLRDRARYPGS